MIDKTKALGVLSTNIASVAGLWRRTHTWRNANLSTDSRLGDTVSVNR